MRLFISYAYRKSHILIVPSSLPVTSHFPSLWKETEVTFMVCPSKVTTYAISYICNHTSKHGIGTHWGRASVRNGVYQDLLVNCRSQ